MKHGSVYICKKRDKNTEYREQASKKKNHRWGEREERRPRLASQTVHSSTPGGSLSDRSRGHARASALAPSAVTATQAEASTSSRVCAQGLRAAAKSAASVQRPGRRRILSLAALATTATMPASETRGSLSPRQSRSSAQQQTEVEEGGEKEGRGRDSASESEEEKEVEEEEEASAASARDGEEEDDESEEEEEVSETNDGEEGRRRLRFLPLCLPPPFPASAEMPRSLTSSV